ncbi:LysR family transcriptional regulator [Pseudonocardia sp. TRM90224]|uniref:LysR family transcriptional regulator n=1 Tax=Pseudonocardia sp. TRM90224 TaxID=2812678 RepID=UPI001E3D556A|nr:LysR family transcriptional regulator [Pseudonocardia sp. TRM90224]
MTMELRHLRCFLAIAEEGSITRAAARLHIGQPALSRTLRQLEQHLGLRLVERSTHHLELTTAGVAFRARAAGAVAAVDAALDPGRLGRWPLRLGHAWSALGRRTPDLLRRWRMSHPDVPLELIRLDNRSAGLLTGDTDIAVLRGDIVLPGARVEFLTTEPRLAAVPAGSPLAGRPAVRLADLAGHTVAVNRESGSTTPELWPPEIRPATLEVTGTDDWLVAVADGRAVGVTAAATAELHRFPGVVFVPITDVPDIPVMLAWFEPPAHPAVPDLVRLARDVMRD